MAEQIIDYLINGIIRNAVNFPSVPADEVPVLSPYIALAEKMGAFIAQIYEGGITEATLEFRGEAQELNTKPVTIAAIKGLLEPIIPETVNFVNAPIIAKERGIEVKETTSPDAGDYHSMLTLRVRADGRTHYVEGTLYGKKEPRLVRVDEFPVEIIPEGIMLYIHNHDRPGVIGNIGSTLGMNNINIARMHFGREAPGGMAISVVSVDQEVPEEVLKELRSLPNIVDVKVVRL